jgi:uncharacterized protein GlcG (DUF336 family)
MLVVYSHFTRRVNDTAKECGMKKLYVLGSGVLMALVVTSGGFSQSNSDHDADCHGLPTAGELQTLLNAAPKVGGDAGGLFHGTRMWAAVVNRSGDVCAFATGPVDQTQVWPGSQAIAKAKAFTANAFSLDTLALSTAMLYTFSQPGHSLWGLNQSQPFDPRALNSSSGKNQVDGGIITFGGGVAIYRNGKIIGGLGVSGDTACTDHEIAKRVRNAAGLNPPGGEFVDDISYSSVDGASVFTHPLCLNTFRNGVSIGTEQPAAGY